MTTRQFFKCFSLIVLPGIVVAALVQPYVPRELQPGMPALFILWATIVYIGIRRTKPS